MVRSTLNVTKMAAVVTAANFSPSVELKLYRLIKLFQSYCVNVLVFIHMCVILLDTSRIEQIIERKITFPYKFAIFRQCSSVIYFCL